MGFLTHALNTLGAVFSELKQSVAFCLLAAALLPATRAGAAETSRGDVLGLMRERCFLCHGPDEGTREADLRLDERTDATRDRGGMFVIKPGDPAASDILERVSSADPDFVMPPPGSGRARLTAEDVERVRQWIAQGAPYSAHWAFTPPVRPEVPRPQGGEWVRNPIDAFVLRRLEAEGMSPSAEADKITLLRRLCLDLTGLPPTLDQVDRFLADDASDAYERQVARLLESPHYGERWGRIWLDAARYADSDGFEKDKPREVWFYRDWVIKALNRDLPYDDFVIQQIAGDLLPGATQDEIVATGFLRNSMLNEEGGIDPEEFRMQAMFDRMDAIGKAILGVTVQCSQCHSHKFDPLTHRDYYNMFAFLNNAHEAQPAVYTAEQQERRAEVFRRIEAVESRLRAETPDWRRRMAAWEETVRDDQPEWTVLPIENARDNTQRYYRQQDGSLLAQGYAPTRFEAPFTATTELSEIRSFRLEVLNHPNLPAGGPGRAVDGQFALTEFKVEAVSVADPDQKVEVRLVRASADFSNEPTQLEAPYTDQQGKSAGVIGPVDYAIDGDRSTGWGIDAGPQRRNQPRKAVFVADRNVAFSGGTRLTFILAQQQGGWNSDDNQTMNLGRFRISVAAEEAVADPLPAEVRALLDIPPPSRSPQQLQRIFRYWRTTVADWQAANDEIAAIWKEHPEGTTQFVLQQREALRETHVLQRGDFLKPLDRATPAVPTFLHSLPDVEGTPDRLDFARWLVHRRSPTASRSIVNRIWQAYFGIGIVDTPEDLGSTGSPPSHPELLDWLAVELVDHEWSLKHVHTLIVESNTYRQSSRVPAALEARDPDNRLLARGPRFRVDAEVVRDIFLAASGLLNPTVGGPSVHPPAPSFLFQRPASYGPKTWNEDQGADRYRRALYTFRFRSVPYPPLQVFDAPSGEFATVRRPRSNTPLQALTTLNEPLFFQCAQALARRVVLEVGPGAEERVTHAFRCCVARPPTAAERTVLLDLWSEQLARFRSGDLDPEPFLDGGHSSDEAPHVSPAELAAWTVVSRVLLNLDETITKE